MVMKFVTRIFSLDLKSMLLSNIINCFYSQIQNKIINKRVMFIKFCLNLSRGATRQLTLVILINKFTSSDQLMSIRC